MFIAISFSFKCLVGFLFFFSILIIIIIIIFLH